ncbi:MAG: WYL domain-containing protein [Eubacterium sp.]|nr:WYL domain-containing protein [Eubacterium sp.]
MPRSSNQKLKLLYLADIFLHESDEQHPLSVKDIISKLSARGVDAERKSVYSDIETLMLNGMDICRIGESSATKYYLTEGDFQLAELQLLADAVACSKFITEKKSVELIKKIERLTSVYQAHALDRTVIVANRVKTINERIYYNIQTLHEAIQNGVKIDFLYFGYDMNKKKQYRSDGARYEMSPYTLAWEDENYYCVGWYEKYDKIANFRVDRMEDIRLTETPALKPDKSFNITDYSKRVFGMFSGEMVKADLQFDKSLITVVLDKFGADTRIKKIDENNFHINVDVNVSPTFFGWLLQFGGKAKVLGPDSLKQDMKKHIDEVLASMKE